RPSSFGRHPENVLGPVLVRVLRVSALSLLSLVAGMMFLKGVGDVLQEDEAENNVLVLGRVHRSAQGVTHLPELRFIADVCGMIPFRPLLSCFRHFPTSTCQRISDFRPAIRCDRHLKEAVPLLFFFSWRPHAHGISCATPSPVLIHRSHR